MAVLVLMALGLGLWLANSDISLATIKYYAVHKTIGISVLGLYVLRVLWHRVSAPPAPLLHGNGWQDEIARWVHRMFYLLLLAMPLTGWVASSASGIDSVVFGRWTLPQIAPESEAIEAAGFLVHGILGKLLILLIALHAGAGIYRGLIKRDGTLRRITLG